MPNAPADDQSFVAGRAGAQPPGPDTAAPFRDTRRQLELISENFPEGALYQYAITGDGRHLLTYLGRGFERVFGDTPTAELPIDAAWLNRRINPADLNALAAARERSQRELTPLHAEVRIQGAGGVERWVSFRAQPRPLPDQGVVWDGAIIDVTERRRAEESVRRQADFLAALNQTTLELLGRRNVSELLQALVARASLLLKSPHAEISLVENGDLVLRAFSKDREYRGGERIRRGEPAISWRAVETRLPVVVERYADHPESRDFHHAPGVHTAAVFPIVRASECVGVLGLAREQPGYPFTSEDLREGMLLAQMAALVLNNAAIHEEAVREAESRTIALRESEERFRGVFDRSPIVMGLLAMPESRIVELNAAGMAAFGVSRDDAVGRTTLELGWWIEAAQRERFLTQLSTTGFVSGFEAEMRRANGETFTALLSGALISIAGQSYSVSSLQDISARKQSEAARDRSLSLMRATLESTADAILVVSGEGRIETYNQNFAEMWGVDITRAGDREYEAELLRKVLGQLVAPELFLTSLRDLYARSEDEVFDVLIAKDGRVLERFSRPQLLGGAVVGRVWSFRDVTDQRKAEEDRRRHEAELRQASKMESLGTLAGGIAHDFNNILTGTFGFVDLARLELPPEHPALAWLDRISASSQRARDLVRQILTFSRKNETERLPQRLQPVATEALKLLRSTLPPMVELQSHIDEHTPPVLADSTQIHQVILNLCTNAWHAMPDGGRITVTLEPCTVTSELAAGHADLEPGRWIRLTVADTGSGMDAATLEHIFEPFFTTKGTGLGTGLGLAVVHGIVKSHEGAITVRSAPGEGSVFDLYFPPAPDDSDPPPPPPGEVPRGHGERILVVDDDNVCGFAVEKIVESLGYVARRHTRPEDALAEFASDPNAVDLVVSDLAMPGMDGAQLIQHLIRIRPDLPVIVITGFIESARQRLLEESPARAVMRKPVSRDDLGRAIAQHLNRKR